MPQDYELHTPDNLDTRTLDQSGQLYTGEITKGTTKQKHITVDIEPYYRLRPAGTKTPAQKLQFDTDFANYAV